MPFWPWQAAQTAAFVAPASASPTATAPRGHASSNVPSARASSAQPLGFMRLRVGWAYLIQLWGDALWQWHLANPDARLTTAATAAVQGAVTARVANYYEGRYQELAAGGLLPAATAIAPLFQGSMNATASNQEVDSALLAAGLKDSADRFAASEGLNRLSYMWRPPSQLPPVLWSVGILH